MQPQSPRSSNSRSALRPLSSEDGDGDSLSPSSSSSSSDSSANYDSATHPIRRSQLFRQPPRFSSSKKPVHRREREKSYSVEGRSYDEHDDYSGNADENGEEDNEDDDDNPGFLPFAQGQSGSSRTQQSQQQQQSSASATPTATTVRSGQDGAGELFGRDDERGRIQGVSGRHDFRQRQQQQQRGNEKLVMSSDGSSLSSSVAALSNSKLSSQEDIGVANTATSNTIRNAGPFNTESRASIQKSTRVPTSTPTPHSTKPSRNREVPSVQSTRQPSTRATTSSATSPVAAGPSKPASTHPRMTSSGSSSNENNSNNNKNQNKYQAQNRSQPPSQTQGQSQSQSRNHSQSQGHHRADLAQLSPRQRASLRRDRHGGSDGGTPSMGSSFSDLDGAS